MSLEDVALHAGEKILDALAPLAERALSGERVNVGRDLLFKLAELFAEEKEARKFSQAPTEPAEPGAEVTGGESG